MAPGKPAVDFNAMINQDRQRRKNEALAQQIFGKGRRSSAPGAGVAARKPGAGPSLASRIGVQKRSSSVSVRAPLKPQRPTKPTTGNVDAEWTHDLHSLNNPSGASIPSGPRATRATRTERLYKAVNSSASTPALNSQFNIVSSPRGSGISIRGLAGPYVVMAKNFAPGTTAADIESAMTPIGGVTLSCRLIAERPNIIAEIVFETKEGADNVVSTFNNQNADGHLLHVYHKIGAAPIIAKSSQSKTAQTQVSARSVTPLGLRKDDGGDRHQRNDRSRDYGDQVTNGSYGFEDRMDTDDDGGQGSGRGLYSDKIVNRNGRGRGNNRDRGRGYR